MKKCPFCAEEVQEEAIKCKHCGEWLNKIKKKGQNECSACEKQHDNTWGICSKCGTKLPMYEKIVKKNKPPSKKGKGNFEMKIVGVWALIFIIMVFLSLTAVFMFREPSYQTPQTVSEETRTNTERKTNKSSSKDVVAGGVNYGSSLGSNRKEVENTLNYMLRGLDD